MQIYYTQQQNLVLFSRRANSGSVSLSPDPHPYLCFPFKWHLATAMHFTSDVLFHQMSISALIYIFNMEGLSILPY